MKLTQTKNYLETNLKNGVEFEVSNNSAKLFSMLSVQLYKEKERSVLTELASNAVDAHKKIGKEDIPIEVGLPTIFQPVLTVRDFGPGLSEEQVYYFLTKYGNSDKTDSNDFIGGFGIGSKSPAAISDSWTIESNHAGVKMLFLVHISEHGVPTINKISDTPTTDTGLKVSIPTKMDNDTSIRWEKAACETFLFYKVKPKFVAGLDASRLTTETLIPFGDIPQNLICGSSFAVPYNRKYNDNAFIVMNYRKYEFSVIGFVETISSYFSEISNKTVENRWIFEGVTTYLPFEISELSVSLSREDIQFDKRSIAVIKSRIFAILDALSNEWRAQVSVASGLVEYKILVRKFIAKYSLNKKIAVLLAIKNGDKFKAPNDYFTDLSKISLTIPNGVVKVVDKMACSIRTLSTRGFRRRAIYLNKKTESEMELIWWLPTSLDIIVENEKNSITHKKVKFYVAEKTSSPNEIVIIQPSALPAIISSGLDKMYEVKYSSGLPLPPKVPSERKPKNRGHFYEMIYNGKLKLFTPECYSKPTVLVEISSVTSFQNNKANELERFFGDNVNSLPIYFVFSKNLKEKLEWMHTTDEFLSAAKKFISDNLEFFDDPAISLKLSKIADLKKKYSILFVILDELSVVPHLTGNLKTIYTEYKNLTADIGEFVLPIGNRKYYLTPKQAFQLLQIPQLAAFLETKHKKRPENGFEKRISEFFIKNPILKLIREYDLWNGGISRKENFKTIVDVLK